MSLRSLSKPLMTAYVLMALSNTVYANINHDYLSVGMGADIQHLQNRNSHINYDFGNWDDAYPLNKANSSTANISLQGGHIFVSPNGQFQLSTGLGLYRTLSNHQYKGQLVETALGDPSSALYDYKFDMTDTRLMAELQLAYVYKHFLPFVNMGAGIGWLRANNYSETAVDSIGYAGLPPFSNSTNTNLAWQVGLGVGYSFSFSKIQAAPEVSPERIALGYRYVDLGKASFNTRGSSYPYSLNLNKVTQNEVYLSYTHLFL